MDRSFGHIRRQREQRRRRHVTHVPSGAFVLFLNRSLLSVLAFHFTRHLPVALGQNRVHVLLLKPVPFDFSILGSVMLLR